MQLAGNKGIESITKAHRATEMPMNIINKTPKRDNRNIFAPLHVQIVREG